MTLNAVDVSALGLVAKALAKPVSDLYAAATGTGRQLVTAWKNAGAIDRLEQRIDDLDRIRTVASRQTASLTEIYYPARISVGKQTRSVDHVEEIAGDRNVLITGTAGQGKSVFLRYLAIAELRRGKRIPLFIELRKIDATSDFTSLLKSHLEINGVESVDQEQLLEQLLGRGAVTLFLDGFDELSREYALPTRDKVATLLNKYKSLRVVISSRPGALSAYVQDLPKLAQVEIAPLTEQDFSPFLKKIGTDDDDIQRLLDAVNRSSTEVKKLLTTPLLLTLLVLTCGQTQQIPDALSDFYDSLFRVLAIMHDDTKPGYVRQMATALNHAQLECLFTCFAFASREKFEKPTLSLLQFEEAHALASKISEIQCTVGGFKTDVAETACLMLVEGLDVTFIHKSVQEYYTARFIKDLPDDESSKLAYEAIAGLRMFTWAQELRFLEEIDPIRYRRFFRKPHITKFLDAVGYSEAGRKSFKRPNLRRLFRTYSVHFSETKSGLAYSLPEIERFSSQCVIEYGAVLDRIVAKIVKLGHPPVVDCSQLAADPDFLSQAEAALEKLISRYLVERKSIEDKDERRRSSLLQILTKSSHS